MEISSHNLARKTCIEHPDAQRQSLKHIAKGKHSPTITSFLHFNVSRYDLLSFSNFDVLVWHLQILFDLEYIVPCDFLTSWFLPYRLDLLMEKFVSEWNKPNTEAKLISRLLLLTENIIQQDPTPQL